MAELTNRKAQSGDYFWRAGQRIEVEHEDDVFTVAVDNEEELERVRALPGVTDVKPVQSRIYRIKVSKEERDKAMDRVRSKEIGRVCHHAYRPRNTESTRYYLTDRITVKFTDDLPRKRVDEILEEAGVRVLREYPGQTGTFLLQVTDEANANPIKVANALAGREELVFAEPNLINRYERSYVPTDTLFDQQWHLRSSQGPQLVADADVGAVGAWDTTRGRRDVVVAVIDDGFDLTHPDFSGDGKVVRPKDYVDGDANPFPVSAEGDYHGTPCAGVAIAEENGSGVVGAAPRCAFMPVRFPLSADDDLLWEIFDFVGKHADVISCSWGPGPVFAPLSQLIRNKFAALTANGGPRKKGCVICFAAGNYNAPLNDPNNTDFLWRSGSGLRRTTGPILNGEATHPDVVAVAASTSLNRKAAYSNWGDEIWVCAPSNNFHPLNSSAFVPGRGVWTTDNEQFGEGFTGGSRFTGRFGGTSSATPLVAAVAALVISANPDLTAAQVKEILQQTADKIVDNEADPVLGRRGGTYDDNGHSEWFGYGKVNAAAAVSRAAKLRPDVPEIESLNVAADWEGTLDQTGSTRLYKVTIRKTLAVRLVGPSGEDFDLYVKKGAPPTVDDYDVRGYTNSPNETVSVDASESGDYYIMVRSYRGAGDYQLRVAME